MRSRNVKVIVSPTRLISHLHTSGKLAWAVGVRWVGGWVRQSTHTNCNPNTNPKSKPEKKALRRGEPQSFGRYSTQCPKNSASLRAAVMVSTLILPRRTQPPPVNQVSIGFVQGEGGSDPPRGEGGTGPSPPPLSQGSSGSPPPTNIFLRRPFSLENLLFLPLFFCQFGQKNCSKTLFWAFFKASKNFAGFFLSRAIGGGLILPPDEGGPEPTSSPLPSSHLILSPGAFLRVFSPEYNTAHMYTHIYIIYIFKYYMYII